MRFHPYLVSVLFTGPSLLVVTVLIPINAATFILFKSMVGGGIYWRAVFVGGQHLIICSTVG